MISKLIDKLSNTLNISRDFVRIALIFIFLLILKFIIVDINWDIILNNPNIVLSNYISDIFITILFLIAIIPAIIVHEVSHGVAAYFLGDNTAKSMGRLSLNPIKHIRTPILLLLFVVVLLNIQSIIIYIFIGIFLTRPVPINPITFSNPRKDQAIVAAAGPISNILLTVLALIILKYSSTIIGFIPNISLNSSTIKYISFFVIVFCRINVTLAIFNLIPIVPLDGGRILYGILPRNMAYSYAQIERFGIIIVAIIWATGLTQYISIFANKIINFLGGIIL